MSDDDAVFEVAYTSAHLARVAAPDREAAKRRFAAYVLYDDVAHVRGDVRLSSAEDARVTPSLGAPPVDGGANDMRAWLAHHDAQTEAFEVSLYEDPQRAIDPYLRLLATNDPWRLEGHGSLGKRLSAVPVHAELATSDGRIAYRFDATQFFDYVRLDIVASLDPARLAESVSIESLIDVSGLRDGDLRQIASSYETIANELRVTARLARTAAVPQTIDVTLDVPEWRIYVAHRQGEPARFSPPPGWTSAFPTFEGQ